MPHRQHEGARRRNQDDETMKAGYRKTRPCKACAQRRYIPGGSIDAGGWPTNSPAVIETPPINTYVPVPTQPLPTDPYTREPTPPEMRPIYLS
jgi:hypothetical protein